MQQAIQSQVQLLDDAISAQGSGSGRGNQQNSNDLDDPINTDPYFYRRISMAREALLDTVEILQDKIDALEQSSKLIVGIQDFHMLKVIGRGGFGTVYLARKVDSNRLYAIKVRQIFL